MEDYKEYLDNLSEDKLLTKILETSYIRVELNSYGYIIEYKNHNILINFLSDFDFKIKITESKSIIHINKNNILLEELKSDIKFILFNIKEEINSIERY